MAVSVATLLWADITNQFVWVVLFVTLGFGLVGFVDDYLKVTRQHHAGLPGIVKLLIEIAIAGTAAVWIGNLLPDDLSGSLATPYFKDVLIDLGWFFVPFSVVVMVAACIP